MANYKGVVDRNLCIGAASCVAIAPTAFTLDNEAKAIVLPTASETDDQLILEAAQSCPVAAIFVYDQDGKQIYP